MQTDIVTRALAEVDACRALRERNLMRRLEMQRRIEAATAKPAYVLKKNSAGAKRAMRRRQKADGQGSMPLFDPLPADGPAMLS